MLPSWLCSILDQDQLDPLPEVRGVTRQLRSGTVGHNNMRTDLALSSGGLKQSEIGREGGTEDLQPLLGTKFVILEGRPASSRAKRPQRLRTVPKPPGLVLCFISWSFVGEGRFRRYSSDAKISPDLNRLRGDRGRVAIAGRSSVCLGRVA